MFPVKRLLDVEMIRDGGSFAATFEIAGGRKFILFIPIVKAFTVWDPPALLDPENKISNDLSGKSVPVTWPDARQALVEMSSGSGVLSERQARWLGQMTLVADHDGRPPAPIQ